MRPVKKKGKKHARTENRALGLARHEWVFLAKFAAFFSVPYALLHVLDLRLLTQPIASFESAFFNAAGVPSSAAASIIFAAGREFEIIPDCTGLVMVILLFALLWSTPIEEKRRRPFFAAGSIFLLAFNLARLFFTLWAGVAWGNAALEAVHVALWFVDSAVVLAVWAVAAEPRIR